MGSLRRKLVSLSVAIVMLVLALGGFSNATVHGQQATSTLSYFSWPASSYDFQNSNNSPQTDINAQNVAGLELRWIYQIPVNPYNIPGAPPALGVETQAIIANGIAYIATPYNRIIALNSVTGSELWSYQVNMTKFIGEKWWAGAYVISGLSLYNQTLYVMSSDTTVYAINALNGNIQWTIPPVAANIAGNTGYYYGEKAPILVGHNLIVRASTTDYGGRGFVAGYDVNTRNMSWIWYSTPPASGDPNWDSDQCQAPCHGNITPYPNDWGSSSQSQFLAGGGAAWGLMAVDNKTNVVYFSTGHPSDAYEAALRPGPNLFTDSLVALNTTNGKMIWYYQYTSHDITEHEGGWSVNLGTVTVNGTAQEVVIQGTKGSQIYVLNAATGKLLYKPIFIGPPAVNAWNDGLTTGTTPPANLNASQALFGNTRICPGPDGGIEMSPALSGNTLYVVTQNGCGLMAKGPYEYKGSIVNGYIYGGDPSATQNSTLYAINLSTGQPIWHYNMPNRYQGSSAVVSGGVVYVVDRGGIMYEVSQQTGKLINSLSLGGLGAAGVSLARDTTSVANMMLFAAAGGGDLPNATPGVVAGYWCGPNGCSESTSTGTSSGTNPVGGGLEQPIIIVLAILVVVLAMYVLLRRRTPAQPRA